MVARRLNVAREIEDSLAAGGKGRSDERTLVGAIAATEEGTAGVAEYCRGVDPSTYPDPEHFLEPTIGTMSARQKVLLALAGPDGAIQRLPREIRPAPGLGNSINYMMPQFVADHGYAFLQQGIVAADPLALEGMLMVHSPVWMPGTERSPRFSAPDPLRFARYAMLMNAVYGQEATGNVARSILARVLATLAPEQRNALDAQVARDVALWQSTAEKSARLGIEAPDLDPAEACMAE